MLLKKGPRGDVANYRAICLLCHWYKLLSAFVALRLMALLDRGATDGHPGWIQTGSMMQGQRVCPKMVHRHGHPGSTQAVVTFIDYSAAFDMESQFIDSALAETGISSKVRRIVQAMFAAATCVVPIRQQDGGVETSDPFNIERGVLQGDIFSPVCFIACLDRIFRLYDTVNPGMTVGTGAHTVRMAKFEYADDAALIDEDAGQATARAIISLAAGSISRMLQ